MDDLIYSLALMEKQRKEECVESSKTLSESLVHIRYHNLKKSDGMARKHKTAIVLEKKKAESTD